MYSNPEFKSRAELKLAIERGERVTYYDHFRPAQLDPSDVPQEGTVTIEGRRVLRYWRTGHGKRWRASWQATAKVRSGVIVKILRGSCEAREGYEDG